MPAPEQFLAALKQSDVKFFAGVPDSLLKEFIGLIDRDQAITHLVCANEGAAVAVGTGYHLGTGKIPLIYMQNSGLGNAVNPLLSLTHAKVYSVPLLLLIGWRGEPGVEDEPQHQAAGSKTEEILGSLGIGFSILSAQTADVESFITEALTKAAQSSSPYAILCRKDAFNKAKASVPAEKKLAFGADPYSYALSRYDALSAIVSALNHSDLIVSTTGYCSRELYSLREKVSPGQTKDFLNVGAMGHASQIALGLALARPNRRVICLDGDGSAIMHMGALATIALSAPANYYHVILNNGVHDSVGAQPTAGFVVNFASIAKACGFQHAHLCRTDDELKRGLPSYLSTAGPALLEVRIHPGTIDNLARPPHQFVERKQAFMESARQ